jgi:SM-20-related protein
MTDVLHSTRDRAALVPAGRSIMPPHGVHFDFLDESLIAGLLNLVASREAEFYQTRVASGIDPSERKSRGLNELEGFSAIFKTKIGGLVPQFLAKLGMAPAADGQVELQLVAHGDGAFFKRHVDTQRTRDRERMRVVTCVYYFHTLPKAFSGGALRIFSLGAPPTAEFVDIEPTYNSLLFFPSWAPHEVLPITCPSRRFLDSRFAINCLVHWPRHPVAV